MQKIHIKKYQFLINKKESTGLKHFNDPKAFIDYSIDLQDVYRNIEEQKIGKKRKILIDFDDMIADVITKSSSNTIVYQRQKIKHSNCIYYAIIF